MISSGVGGSAEQAKSVVNILTAAIESVQLHHHRTTHAPLPSASSTGTPSKDDMLKVAKGIVSVRHPTYSIPLLG